MIKRVKIYKIDTPCSNSSYKYLENQFARLGIEIVDENPEMVIAIGGDGTFINAIREEEFNTEILFVGIHCGHLGFLQEINSNQIDSFLKQIKNESYVVYPVRTGEATIYTKNGKKVLNALNEIVLRAWDLRVIHINIYVDGHFLERFSGDGLIASTPLGSTAYNMSAGGSIVYPTLDNMQVTPLAPLNSKIYRSLTNSIIVPPRIGVTIVPENPYSTKLMVFSDGEQEVFEEIEKIEIRLKNKKIKTLRLENYSFWTRIQEKFL